jgi:transposase
MGYKKMKKNLEFADFALANSLKHNRSLKNMEKLDKAIDWSRVESILLNHYTVGTSGEGADAYPPLLLFKCMLLQKWFHIDSDPELENQINDRWSFKKFLHLALSKPSPDHSTFSRFRTRLSKKAMDQINSEILRQFENQGLSINEGIALLMLGSLNPPAALSAMISSKSSEKKQILPMVKLIKMVNLLNSQETSNQTGWYKKTNLILGLKSMPPLISITALSWPPP